jgi:hypothetical protein
MKKPIDHKEAASTHTERFVHMPLAVF